MKVIKHGPNMTELVFTDGARVLVSYEAPVAAFFPTRGWLMSMQFFSRTTSKHIRAWLNGTKAAEVPQSVIVGLLERR